MSRRNANKLLAILHGIFEHAVRRYGLLSNPVKGVEKLRESYQAARFDFYSPEDIRKLVAGAGDPQDGTIYLTAAFTGLRRGELIGLLWEDIDFEYHAIRVWETVTRRERGLPKSRRARTVPMVDDVAYALKRLNGREYHTQPKDPPYSSARMAERSTAPLCAAATSTTSIEPACASCASTICATRSGRLRSTLRRSSKSKRGWVMPTSR
jgi:integrase